MPKKISSVLRRASAMAVLVLSVAAALWLALGNYKVGLDLQGGAILTFNIPEAKDAVEGSLKLEQLRETARSQINHGLRGMEILSDISFSRDEIHLELINADENEVSQLLQRIGPADFRLLTVRLDLPPLTASDRSALEAQLVRRGPTPPGTQVLFQEEKIGQKIDYTAFITDEQPLIRSGDLADAVVGNEPLSGPCIRIKLTPEAAKRFQAYTAAHVGSRIAMVLDGEVLMAPSIYSALSGDFVLKGHFTFGEATELAARLRSSVRPSIGLLQKRIIPSYQLISRTVTVALGALAAAAWLLAIVVRRRVAAFAVAAGIAALPSGLASILLLTGLLMLSYVPTLIALAVVAAATVVLLRRHGGPADSLAGRLAVAWPGLALLAAVPLAGFIGQGFLRGFAKGAAVAAFYGGFPVLIMTGLAVFAASSASPDNGG